MTSAILEGLLRASLAGSVGVLLVLALRVPARGLFGPRAAYSLWIAPPLMALASLLPTPRALTLSLPDGAGLIGENAGGLVLLTWLGGAILLAGAFALVHRRFLKVLGKPSLDEGGLPILRARDDGAVGPAVIGAINARIVLPADFDDRYSAQERAMVLAHERNHLFGHDAQAITVAVLLRCLNWFNPLAHIGAYFLRIDQELACDAAVLGQYPKARRTYAQALVKTQLAGAAPPFGCQWPARGKNPLEQRIELLAQPERGRGRRLLGGGLVAAFAIAASAFAWAAEPPALFARPPQALNLYMVLKDDLGILHRSRPLELLSGESVTRPYEVREGDYWQVTVTPTLRRSGEILIQAEIEHDGELSRPSFLIDEGEPRTVRLGDRNLLVTAKRAD